MQQLNIIQRLIPQSRWPVLSPNPMPNPHWIVIHGTGNDATAANEIANMTNNNGRNSDWGVSFHFAVDDREIVQGLPLDRHGWHASDGNAPNGGNRAGIGIEICFDRSGGPRYIAAERKGANLVAHLLHERNWSIERVRTHQSFCPRNQRCPRQILNSLGGFDRFLTMVQGFLSELNVAKKSQPPAQIGTVTLKNGTWNVKSTPSNQGRIQRTVQANTFPIIARNADGWAQLTCNGWISPSAIASDNDPSFNTGRNPQQTPQPSQPQPTLEQVARQVIRGDFGNGDDRRKRLTAAGFNAANVQQTVNALLANPPRPTPNLPLLLNNAPPTAPKKTAQPSQSLDDLAREVIRGNWGNGAERVRRLTAAGHDSRAVQNRVNELLR